MLVWCCGSEFVADNGVVVMLIAAVVISKVVVVNEGYITKRLFYILLYNSKIYLDEYTA